MHHMAEMRHMTGNGESAGVGFKSGSELLLGRDAF